MCMSNNLCQSSFSSHKFQVFLASKKEDVIGLLFLIHLDNENRSMAIKFFYMLFMLKNVSHNTGSCSSQMRSICREKERFTMRRKWPWLGWLSGLSIVLQTERWRIRFLVRAHVWVAGHIPRWEPDRGNGKMFLSLSFSFPLPLKINK